MSQILIFENIGKHITLDESEKSNILSHFTLRDVQKKEIILTQGQICKKIFYVESGSFRALNLNKEGKESTIMFAIKDWWITDMNCFVNQLPAEVSIEALEPSKIMELEHQSLEDLYLKVPKLERYFRILFQKAYVREQIRTLNSLSKPIEERFKLFLESYPSIVEKVTQKQIASYLGVTPEFLSSIKKKA